MFLPLRPRKSTFAVNPPLVVAWAFFWVYGFYASVSFDNLKATLATNAALTMIFVYLMDLARCERKRILSISTTDIAAMATFLGLTLLVGWREITDAICNDQFYHMQIAFAHALRLLAPDVLQLGSPLAQQLLHTPFRMLLYVVNACLQILLLLMFCGLHRLPYGRLGRAFAAALVFWILRQVVATYVLQGDVHPPLRLFWLNYSTAFFGISNFALRLPGLLGIAILVTYIIRRLSPKLGPAAAWALAFAIGTLPLLWHVGTMAEASIWGALAFAAMALAPILDRDRGGRREVIEKKFDFLPVYALLAIIALSREAAFIGAVPLIGVHVFITLRVAVKSYRKNEQRPNFRSFLLAEVLRSLSTMWREAYPLIIIVPLTLFTLHTGTPATDHSGLPLSQKLTAAVGSGAVFDYLRYDFGLPWFLIMIAGLLPWTRRNRLVLAHFALAVSLFFSINPYLWGGARYQLEIGIAAAVSGIIELSLLVDFLITRRWRAPAYAAPALLVAASVALVAFNVHVFKSIHQLEGIVDNVNFLPRSRDASMPVLGEINYAFDDAFADIKRRGLSKGLYVDGTVYWVGGQILAGYDLEEITTNSQLPSPTEAVSVDTIDRMSEIKSALYADRGEQHKQASVRYLTDHGWSLAATYPHYGLKDNLLYLMVRQ